MPAPITLVGLDFGTTTSSAVVASAQLMHNAVNGRVELSDVFETYRSPIVFTPIRGETLDVAKAAELLDGWLTAGAVRKDALFGGGALLTGLTAQRANAAALVRLIRERIGAALVATADDPCLEAWLAFHGNSSNLSLAHPTTPILNLDIGGGTTNLALGVGGQVLRTGCLFVGARHVEVEPGSYRIRRVSAYARRLLDRLGIAKGPGDMLTDAEVNGVLDFYLQLLQSVVGPLPEAIPDDVVKLHQQVPFLLPEGLDRFVVTLSGGVGELVYAARAGKPWPSTTQFGDLGIDLARRLAAASFWVERMGRFVPDGMGRATVYGLLRHSTQVSGSTLFLPCPETLPLTDLPIFGTITESSPEPAITAWLDLVQRSARGGCLQVALSRPSAAQVRTVGGRLAGVLHAKGFAPDHPLVLLVRENAGKVLGHYVTAWDQRPLNLVVLDEIAVRDAQYAHIGKLHNQIVPVSFYGLRPRREPS